MAKAVDGVDLDDLSGRSGGPRRRVRLRQERNRAEHPAADSRSARTRSWLVPSSIKGQDLLKLSWEDMREVRGNEISMIFQEPMTSLNPVFTIGMPAHGSVPPARRRLEERSLQPLRRNAANSSAYPKRRSADEHYPHQFSGGMRQRVMIAMALACNPSHHRRRTDDGARRDDPGADSRPDAQDQSEAEGMPRSS